MTEYEKHLFETVHWCTEEDKRLFDEWTGFLPKRDAKTPYHSGPHSLERFRMFYQLVQPKRVLEIGFNLGHSAAIWLALGVKGVTSVQPEILPKTLEAEAALTIKFRDRFMLVQSDSRRMEQGRAERDDVIFIDGSHEYEWVDSDIKYGLKYGFRNYFMDDYDSHHGPGVVRAVHENRLVVKAVFGTMAWCITREGMALRHDPEA